MTSPGIDSDVLEGGASKSQSESITSQPTANGTVPYDGEDKAPPPASDRSEDSSDDSLMDGCSTNDISRLLPRQPASSSALRKQRGADGSTSPPPIFTPPSASSLLPASAAPAPRPSSPPSRSSTCNKHTCSRHQHPHGADQKRLSSTKSHASLRTDAAHIKEVAGDDCCVHCLLACLFCEMLSMCSAVGDCLACGVGGAACCDGSAACCCCCCVEAAGEAACTEEACQAVLDCGILEDCCASSDCLEICLECCSICFPT